MTTVRREAFEGVEPGFLGMGPAKHRVVVRGQVQLQLFPGRVLVIERCGHLVVRRPVEAREPAMVAVCGCSRCAGRRR